MLTERPAPSAQGTLDQRPLAHLVFYAFDRRLSGTMEFRGPDGAQFTLLFLEGKLVKGKGPAALGPLHELVERLYDLPSDTSFAYLDSYDALASQPSAPAPLELLPVVWRAIRRNPPWQQVHDALSKIGDAKVRMQPDADLAALGLEDRERYAAGRLAAGALSIFALTNEEILVPGRTQLLVYFLLLTKSAQLAPADAAPPPQRTVPPLDAPVVLAAEPPSSSRAVARVRLAKGTNPGLLTIEEHPATVSSSDGRTSAHPPPVASKEGSPPVEPPPHSRPGFSALRPAPASDKRRTEILARAAKIDTEDYFAMLEVARDSDTDAIRAAFFALAKVWHPDRLPENLADAKVACAKVFARMSEAHQTLTDTERRNRYMRLLKEGGASPKEQETIAQVVDAATNFQKAEVFLKRGDLAQATAHCQKAVDLDPKQAEYLALSVWLESMKPANQTPAATEKQIEALTQALSMNEKCERAYFYRGMLYKRLERGDAAFYDFKRSSELNPRNVDSQREVRLYNMRAGKSESPRPGKAEAKSKKGEPKGFFGRLFKK